MNIFGFHVKRDFPNSPLFQLSSIPTFQLRSEAELSSFLSSLNRPIAVKRRASAGRGTGFGLS